MKVVNLSLSSALCAFFFVYQSAWADDIYTEFFSDKAVGGYDAVAYFTQNKPVKGKAKYKTRYQGAKWYFSRSEHLEAFLKEPGKYAPQYGGHCAWAVGENAARAPGDPKLWTIVDGKLYLNYNKKVNQLWASNRAPLISQGDINWREMTADDSDS